MPRRQRRSPLVLTERDMAVLRTIATLRGVPIEHLADEFFDEDPFLGTKNKNPARACERRLRELACAGFVRFVREYDGERRRQLIVLDNAANDISIGMTDTLVVRRARRRRVPVRTGAHHVRTLDALVQIRRDIEQRGGRIVSVVLDGDLRGTARRGRRTVAGDEYPLIPDAVLHVQMPGEGEKEIAVEYVTSKYCDKDIREKHAAFARYASAIWVADRKRTAERVRALTEESCRVLS